MLRAKPEIWAHTAGRMARRWWDGGPTRQRLRRRLALFSLPLAAALLGLTAVLATNLVTGARIAEDFNRHDIDALRADIGRLDRWNILPGNKVPFAQGGLAVLEGRLADADELFSTAVAHSDDCPARINLELVRETRGDLAATAADPTAAELHYTAALAAVTSAPQGCFSGNADPDPDRRHIRQDAEPRLRAKIDSLHHRTPPPGRPASSATGAPPTTAPSPAPDNTGPNTPPVFGPNAGDNATAGSAGGPESLTDIDADRLPASGSAPKPAHRLGVNGGDPLDILQQALRDASATGSNRE